MQLPIALVRREVHDVHRQLLAERHRVVVLAGLHLILHAVRLPAEHILGELRRLLEPNAAVTRRARGLREERFLIRVV